MHIYDEKYIKPKVKEFNSVVNANFLDDELPKEGGHHPCIACKILILLWKWKKELSSSVFRRMQG